MSTVSEERWQCSGGNWVRLRDGRIVTITPPTGGGTFNPAAKPKPMGIVCVIPSSMSAVPGGYCDHYVAKISWSAIEPSQGTYDWSSIDALLSTYPTASMTLRILAGGTTPGWAYTLSGGTVSVYNTPAGGSVTVGYVWNTAYLNAWRDMIAAAGARYDSNPRVVMVSACATMCMFAEPFIIGDSTPTSGLAIASAMGVPATTAGETTATNLWTAGISNCVASTIAGFPNTRVELAIHSALQTPTPLSKGFNSSWPAGRTLALTLATQYGRQLVFSDYGLSDTDTFSTNPASGAAHIPTGTIDTENDEYCWMYLRTQGNQPYSGPCTYQATIRGTSSPTGDQLTNFGMNAASLNGWHAEHSGWAPLTNAQASSTDAALKSNATSEV